ncbi:MAG: aldo/keto reductase [Alphaproteobacteria bacterium]|nr:aldo/keto reductase [Alphaproteobacteria bacterium]
MTITRRQLLISGATLATLAATPLPARDRLPVRPIPSSGERLPIIGLGNSNAFREGDREKSRELLKILIDHGGAYVDCGGSSRFVVATAAAELGLGDEVFLGTYFTNDDETQARGNAALILDTMGKPSLDLMQAYPEFAVPNWAMFRHWKDEGLTRHIGVARHNLRYYDAMMKLMETGTVDVLQVNYSPLETEAEDRILPMAMDKGVAVTINRPFINGQYFSLVRGHTLPEWAAEFDCETWAQFSLKYIVSHPAVNCVLTETANPAHAVDNLSAGFGRLPDAAMRRRIVEHLRSLA